MTLTFFQAVECSRTYARTGSMLQIICDLTTVCCSRITVSHLKVSRLTSRAVDIPESKKDNLLGTKVKRHIHTHHMHPCMLSGTMHTHVHHMCLTHIHVACVVHIRVTCVVHVHVSSVVHDLPMNYSILISGNYYALENES